MTTDKGNIWSMFRQHSESQRSSREDRRFCFFLTKSCICLALCVSVLCDEIVIEAKKVFGSWLRNSKNIRDLGKVWLTSFYNFLFILPCSRGPCLKLASRRDRTVVEKQNCDLNTLREQVRERRDTFLFSFFFFKAFDGDISFNSALHQGQQERTGHLYFKGITLQPDISAVWRGFVRYGPTF